MKRTRVYLDTCCFNRPYDNQSNLLIFLETEAKLFVQDLILKEELELVWSFILDYENNDNPFIERKESIASWKRLSATDLGLCDEIAEEAENLMNLGLRQKDASHIACAKYSNCDYFLTTDKKILSKPVAGIEIVNPIDFVRRYLSE